MPVTNPDLTNRLLANNQQWADDADVIIISAEAIV